MLHACIDIREHALFDHITFPFEKKSLTIGDIHVVYPDAYEILIERKTGVDFLASITDGRYREQRARLFEWKQENPVYKHVIYLIENEDICKNEDRELIRSCIHRLSFHYHFMIHITMNVQQSCEYLHWLCKQTTLFKEINTEKDKLENWKQSSGLKKKDIQTPSNFLLYILTGIHGISLDMAKNIIKTTAASTMVSFIECLTLTPPEILQDIQVHKKKIGKQKIKTLYSMLGI